MALYTDSDAIEAYLGATFTPEQATAADAVAAAVTAFIDRYTGRTWQTVSPITGELRRITPPLPGGGLGSAVVFLAHTPVLAVSAVSVRSAYPNDDETVLEVGAYELRDAAHGVVALDGWSSWWCGDLHAVVDYTYGDAVPADIALAATMIASGEMARQLAIQSSSGLAAAHPELAGLKSIAVGQNDITIQTSGTSAATSGGAAASGSLAPPGSAARAILDGYRRWVIA